MENENTYTIDNGEKPDFLNRIQKFFPLLSFVLGTLTMLAVLYAARRIGNDSYAFFSSGDDFKTVSDIRMLARNFINGESLWYSFSVCMGSNISLLLANDFFSPFNLLYIIFYNADICLVAALAFSLKVGTASMFFQLFSSKGLKIKNFYSVIFALLYATCGFSVKYPIFNNFWAEAVYILPIVALGIVLAVRERKYFVLIVGYSFAFISNFYTGFIIGVFSFVFFFLYLFLGKTDLAKNRIIQIVKYICSVFISILISAFAWVPTLYCILKYYPADSLTQYPISINFADVLSCLFWGVSNSSNRMPHVNCGVLSVLVFVLFFINKNIEKKIKIIVGSLTAFGFLCFLVPPFYAFIHAFDRPTGFDFRFSFVFSFIVCAASCYAMGKIEEINTKWLCVCSGSMIVFLILIRLFNQKDAFHSIGDKNVYFVGNLFFVLLWSLMLFYKKAQKKLYVFAGMLIIALVEIISDGYLKHKEYTLIPKTVFDSWSYYMSEVASDVENDDSFYRINFQNDINANSGLYWGFNSMNYFQTSEISYVRDTLFRLGFVENEHVIHSTGLTPLSEMLFGIKYNYTGDDLYEDVYKIPSPLTKEENEYYISTGFMVDEALKDLEFDGFNAFENNNETCLAASGVGDVFKSVPTDYLSYLEEGIEIDVSEDELFVLKTTDSNDPTLYFLIDGYNEAPKYVQFQKNYNPFYINYYLQGAENIMFLDPLKSDSSLSYSPVLKMKKDETDGKNFIIVKSYEDEGFGYGLDDISFYELDYDNLKLAYNNLKDEPFVIEESAEGYLKGRVEVVSDKKLLYISVPFIDGWNATVNGENKEIIPVLNRSFIGIMLPGEGVYDIELKFECPYLKAGAVLSIAGLILGLMCLYFEEIKNKMFKKRES